MDIVAAGGVALAGGLTVVVEPGYRSARVQAEMRKHWKEVVKRQAPAYRERFLDSAEGRAALGAATCKQLLKVIRSQFESIAGGVAADYWIDAWRWHGELPPGLEFDGRGRLVMQVVRERDEQGRVIASRHKDGRRAAARLVLGAAGVRTGAEHPPGTDPLARPIASVPTRRWTPPQAVEIEDRLDGFSQAEALQHDLAYNAASPSAHAIEWVGIRKGKRMGREPQRRGGDHRGWR